MKKLRCLYISRFCPNRTRTDPYTGLPWFLSENTEMVGIWGRSREKAPFWKKCKNIIEIDPRWRGLAKTIISVMRLIGKRNNIDIILCGVDEYSLFIGLLVSLRTKTPFFSIVEDPPFTNRYECRLAVTKKMEKRAREFILGKLLNKCSGIFCFIEREVLKGIDLKDVKIYQLLNGAGPDGITWKKKNKGLGSASEEYIVGYIGEINCAQGIGDLIEIFAIAKRKKDAMHLKLIGPINENFRKSYEEKIARYEMKKYVKDTGWLPYEEMLRELNECDVGVYCNKPTKWFQVAHPLKICEYLSLEKPIVSWDYAGVRRLLDNGKYGILVPGGEKANFAEALISLANPVKRKGFEREIGKAISGELCSDYWYRKLLNVLGRNPGGN